MPRKWYTPEEIVAKPRQVEVLTSQGSSIADGAKASGVTEATHFRWRREFGDLKSDQVKRIKALETENLRLRKAVSDLTLDKLILKEAARETSRPGPSPGLCRARRAEAGDFGAARLGCAWTISLDAAPDAADDEAALMADIVALARTYGRYGDRRIHEMLETAGWDVNVKRVARIWRREGLKVPVRQPKRRRLWLNDGSCVRLRP